MNEEKKDISMRLSKIRSEFDEESYYDFTSDDKIDTYPRIFHETFITETTSIKASEKVDVHCKVFQPMKWIEHSFAHSFKTEKVENE